MIAIFTNTNVRRKEMRRMVLVMEGNIIMGRLT